MKTIFGGLPFLATLLWTAFCYSKQSEQQRSWRWSFALATLVLGAFSLVEVEALSALHLLFFGPVLTLWVIFTATPACLLFFQHCNTRWNSSAELARFLTKLSSLPIWALIILAGTLLLSFLMALCTPPMNFDVQIYHLPRQIFWMMQGSVENFPASHTHQISMPVLGEFLGLNLLILSGGDAWHNLVQLLFALSASGLVTLLARVLGAKPRGQILSLLFVLLIPVLFFETSNAKNDIILSFFILLPLLLGIRLWNRQSLASLPNLLLAGLSAGLALATKGTAVAYLVPSALLIAIACRRQHRLRLLLLASVPTLLLALLPATPQMLRNWNTFHSLAGPNLHHTNLRHDPLSLGGVALRNLAGQFTSGSEDWNHLLELKTRTLLTSLGISADDPSTTFEGQEFHLPYFVGLEDIAPAPVQTSILLLLPIGFFIPSFRRSPGTLVLGFVILLSLFLFCFIFRWQPWQGRLLIPAYFMAAPLAGMLGDLLRPRWFPLAITLLELFTLQPHLMFAGQRPLFGGASIFRMSKAEQMSRMMPGRAEELEKLVLQLRKMEVHRIVVDGGATEIYGLLRKIRQALPLVIIISGHYEQARSADALITTTTRDAGVPPPPIQPHPTCPKGFQLAWGGLYYRVFAPVP